MRKKFLNFASCATDLVNNYFLIFNLLFITHHHVNNVEMIVRFCFILPYILLLLGLKNSSLYQGLRYIEVLLIYQGSTVIYIFARIFQHLNVLLVYFDPKSYQNACLYKTALSPRLLHFQTSKAMWHLQRWGMESFFMKVLH